MDDSRSPRVTRYRVGERVPLAAPNMADCGLCGGPLDTGGACVAHCAARRVTRMDGPARTTPSDGLGARLQMADIAARTVG